ncbi:hypothetical protein V6Z11_A10G261400 [Gossypium hirsutum]
MKIAGPKSRNTLSFTRMNLQLQDYVLNNFFHGGFPSFLCVPKLGDCIPSARIIFVHFHQCGPNSLVHDITVFSSQLLQLLLVFVFYFLHYRVAIPLIYICAINQLDSNMYV